MKRILVILGVCLVVPPVTTTAAQGHSGSERAALERYLAGMSWPLRAATGRAQRVHDAIRGAVSPGDPPFLGMVAESCRKLRDVENVGRARGVGAILRAVPPRALAATHRALVRTYVDVRAGCNRARVVALAARRALEDLGPNPTEQELSRATKAALEELVRFDRTKLRPFKQAVRVWRVAVQQDAKAVGLEPPDWIGRLQLAP
jgi:hypothetical protein